MPREQKQPEKQEKKASIKPRTSINRHGGRKVSRADKVLYGGGVLLRHFAGKNLPGKYDPSYK